MSENTTFATPVQHIIMNSLLKTTLETKVTVNPSEVALIQTMLTDKVVGEKLAGLFVKILEDGKIDVYDVPNLVLVLAEIYNSHVVQNGITGVDVIVLVQLTLDCILESGAVPIPEFEIKIIRCLVDSSLKLLATNLPAVKRGCFSFCHCLFGCCSRGGLARFASEPPARLRTPPMLRIGIDP